MKPYSVKYRGRPKFTAGGRGITKAAKQQIIIANRSRHKSERRMAQKLIRQELSTSESAPTRIIIVCSGGITQAVYSDAPVRFAVVDYDEEAAVDGNLVSVADADVCDHDLKQLYYNANIRHFARHSVYKRIYDLLIEKKF